MTHAPPQRRGHRARGLLVGALTGLALLVPQVASADTTVTQLAGATPVQAAIAWSQATFADDSTSTALLSRDDDFADALASGTAQGLLSAPLLYTNSAVLSPETLLELNRLGVSDVVILGGTDAVGDSVQAALELAGFTVTRVGGATRIETAVLLATTYAPNATEAVLARAFGTDDDPTQAFADSLAATAYTTITSVPVILTDTADLYDPTAEYLETSAVEQVLVLGGEAAVNQPVLDEIEGLDVSAKGPEGVLETRRAAGNTRFGTAVAAAAEIGYATAADAPRVILIEGQEDFAAANGLPAGVQAGNGAALVLSNGEELNPETATFLTGGDVDLICGPGVTDAACAEAEDLLTP